MNTDIIRYDGLSMYKYDSIYIFYIKRTIEIQPSLRALSKRVTANDKRIIGAFNNRSTFDRRTYDREITETRHCFPFSSEIYPIRVGGLSLNSKGRAYTP